MKKKLKNKCLIFLLLCIFALVGCGKNQDKMDKTTEAKETTEDIIDDTTTESAKDDNSDRVMLYFGSQPGGDMSLEEFEAATISYNVYFSGTAVYNKSDQTVKLNDEDFEKIESFCDDVISGNIKVTEDNGADLPSFDVTVYDKNGGVYELNTYSNGWIEGTDEIIDIVMSYFEEDDYVDDVTEADYNWFYETYGVEYGINNIDELSRDYSVENAIEDGCFVIGAMVHNDYLYDEFMKQYENEEIAYIRVVQSTTEGDAIIYDIFYRPESKEWMDAFYSERLFVVVDSTRDKFAAEDDRTITMRIFDGVAEYEGDTGLYWVAYRGNVDDIDLDSDDTFVIAHIN
ncbi:MAG: DUF4362 domain-containing protein [Lachnospiraceae bacterium]|nr:DUF4362 domain-containing protein [Lachnospiraceae bacterium]